MVRLEIHRSGLSPRDPAHALEPQTIVRRYDIHRLPERLRHGSDFVVSGVGQ
jgi:hypothetical protein